MPVKREQVSSNNNYTFHEIKGESLEISSPFEELLENVGSEGKFQKLLIFGFMIPLALVSSFGNVNTTLLFSTPDHSCHVPGRAVENVSLEEWKNFTIPWENDEVKGHRISSCFRFKYPRNSTNLYPYIEPSYNLKEDSEVVACDDGWDFDKSTWEATPVTDFEWVCDKKHLVTTLFSLGFAGNALGTILFSLLSDRYGRKPVFYMCVVLNVVCGGALVFTQSLHSFGAIKFILSLAFCSFCQVPYIIVVEVCGERMRTLTAMVGFISSVVGSCFTSLFAHASSHWKIFVLVCHLPAIIFLFYIKFLPESPRWLLSRSRVAECEEILKRIAKTNGKEYCERSRFLLLEAQKEGTKKTPFKTILSSFVLVKHVVITSTLISIQLIIYQGIILNIHNMSGNNVLNFFILALVEIPGNVVGSISGQYLGRRLSAVIFAALTACFCIACSFVVKDAILLATFCSLTKLFVSALLLIVYLQIGELFPTSFRASAYGVISMVGITSLVIVPPLIAMGNSQVYLPYYILFGIGVLGFILATLLPETLGQPLPQTVEAAMKIGRNQPFFTIIHKWNAHKYAAVSPSKETYKGLGENWENLFRRYSLDDIE